MLTHRGYTAWIVCEGKILPEYNITIDKTTHRVTCWIPSEEGKSFQVRWRDDHSSRIQSAGYIDLDGFIVPGRFLYGYGETYRAGVRTGPNRERPFIFARVEDPLSSEESLPSRHMKGVGNIILKIKRVVFRDQKTSNAIQPIPPPVGGVREHCATFGSERPTFEQYCTTWDTAPFDPRNPGSFVTFVFRYQSQGSLEANGIGFSPLTKPPSLLLRPPPTLLALTPPMSTSHSSPSSQVLSPSSLPLDINIGTPSKASYDFDALLAAPSVLPKPSPVLGNPMDIEIFTLPVTPLNCTVLSYSSLSPSLSQAAAPASLNSHFVEPVIPSLASLPRRSAKPKAHHTGYKGKRQPRSQRLAPGEMLLQWGPPSEATKE